MPILHISGPSAYPWSYNLGGFTSQLPSAWGSPSSFPLLETLNLFGYNLIGSLPAEWGCATCLPNLQVLQIAGSPNLTGSLPVSWGAPGSFPQLKLLNLAAASLTGSIPAAWVSTTAFVALTYLSLANTTLTGAVPGFNNSQLAVLDLSFSRLSGDISTLWSSTSTTISAIGLTAVSMTGAFPYQLPAFWHSLQVLIVDNTSISGTIPTSWLEVSAALVSPHGYYTTVQSQMQNVSFSGGQLWARSVADPAWWQDLCSSFSKTAGYAANAASTYVNSQTYSGIRAIDGAVLDVTRVSSQRSATLPTPNTTRYSYSLSYYSGYYSALTFNGAGDFNIQGGHPYGGGFALPSPVGHCYNLPRATPVVAAWAAFGASLAALLMLYGMWLLISRWQPAVLSNQHTTVGPLHRFGSVCAQSVPLLGLEREYVYSLLSDIRVCVAVWNLGFGWGKAVLAILLIHYAVRALILTLTLSMVEGRSWLQTGLTLLCLPLVLLAMPIVDVLCSFKFLHISFGPINPDGYRHLRILVVTVVQSLPSAILITVIYYQGAAPFVMGSEFKLLRVLESNQHPVFLSRSLFLQAVVSSLVSVLWGRMAVSQPLYEAVLFKDLVEHCCLQCCLQGRAVFHV